ncbi:MAG: hypothetical protein V3W26_03750 [Thermodesulfobacteriota bacterium]
MSPDITGKKELICPLCDVDVPLLGDEVVGEQILCIYCQCPLKIKKTEDDDICLEEDF